MTAGRSSPFVASLFVQASVDKLMTNYVEAEYQSQGAAIRGAAVGSLWVLGQTDAAQALWENAPTSRSFA